MSIIPIWPGYDVTCDTCGQTTFYEAECFSWLIEEIKREGWTIRKDVDGEWNHKCPACGRKP